MKDFFLLTFAVHQYPVLMMFWNLFLAALPCVIAHKMKRFYWPVFVLWFFLFPNTAYLFVEVRHLLDLCQEYDPMYRVCENEAWMVMFFFFYAALGLPLFYAALKKMTALTGPYFPAIMIPFTAIGALFGLVDRLNSWDVLFRPFLVAESALSYFAQGPKFLNLMAFTLLLYGIYYGADFICHRRS